MSFKKQTNPRKEVSLRKAAVVVEPTSSEQHSAEKEHFDDYRDFDHHYNHNNDLQ